MRAVLWDLLLLLWLCARARGDCRAECRDCQRLLYRDGFDVLICILECEGQAVPRATWELCAATGPAAPRPRRLSGHAWPSGRRDHREEEQQREEDEEEEDIWRRAAAGRAAKGVQKSVPAPPPGPAEAKLKLGSASGPARAHPNVPDASRGLTRALPSAPRRLPSAPERSRRFPRAHPSAPDVS